MTTTTEPPLGQSQPVELENGLPGALQAGHPVPSPLSEEARPSSAWQRFKEQFTPARPTPWILRKLAVFIVYALAIWSFYVVVGRICAPAIQQRSPLSTLARATGAGFLAGFVVLWLLFVWIYTMIVTTGPGFAVNVVPKCPPPDQQQFNPFLPAPLPGWPGAVPVSSAPGQGESQLVAADNAFTRTGGPVEGADPNLSGLAPVAAALGLAGAGSDERTSESSQITLRNSQEAPNSKKQLVKDWRDIRRPTPMVQYGPRWCQYCKINKPDRAHHCRHCATCVLQYDHHCLWIGQCVGWANHKHFVVFNLWAMLFCAYIVAVSAIYMASTGVVDGQVIGLIAVAGLFAIFTAMMGPSHVWLIIKGQTTLESHFAEDQTRHEQDVLNNEFGYWCHRAEKRKVKQMWRDQWGGTPVDARWAFGSPLDLWKQEMGKSWIGWFLPIGRPLGDGVHFPSNPRFGPNGEWLRREQWPTELQ